ncbi:uncharacterized protein LOC133899883 isoform X2 [Phragmites australis]|nr:uncharacterized protein LOC133899883 isoform X2 [Phragmites australis]
MDLGTENRLAALLVEETRRRMLQADKKGVQAYQANRDVEVDGMWRAREKEVELGTKLKSRTNGHTDSRCKKRKISSRSLRPVPKIEQDGRPCATSCSARYSHSISYSDREDGLGDDELEEFLHSRSGGFGGNVGQDPHVLYTLSTVQVCYSWWVLSSLIMIDRVHWIDKEKLTKFILNCQDQENGGISDRPDNAVDIYHTYFGVAAIKLLSPLRNLTASDPFASLLSRGLTNKRLGSFQ